MNVHRQRSAAARPLLWIARIAGTLAIVPLMMIAFGDAGAGDPVAEPYGGSQ